jgi:flagellar motility protein MotE (MotC chaperone)
MKKDPGPPRLLPALMVTLTVLLGLKAVAFAEGAGETAQPTKAEAPPAPATAAPAAPAAPAAATNACAADSFATAAGLSPSEVQVLQSLGARRTALDARAAEMDTRQELLAAAERRLEERLAELKRVETRVQALTTQVDDSQNQRITQLVDVYQRMRAKDAAAVFDALDQDVLVDVASRMRQANLAEVMGKMNPARARQLTLWLARERGVDVAALTAPVAAPPRAAPAAQQPAAQRAAPAAQPKATKS